MPMTRSRLMNKASAKRRMALCMPLLLLAGTACWPFSPDEQIGEMTLERLAGRVQVVRGTEAPVNVEGSFSLEPGDIIQTAAKARAHLRLEGDREAFIFDKGEAVVDSVKAMEIDSGKLLAEAQDSMKVSFGSVVATGQDAVFRIDQGFASTRAATYSGEIRLAAPGQETLRVPSLFQASIAANDLPAIPRPYGLSEDDRWDSIHIEKWVNLDRRLTTLSGGLASQLQNQRPTLPYFNALADDENVGFMRNYLNRSTVNLLIGFSIAESAKKYGPLDDAFQRAFQLYDLFEAEPHWGIVAGILNASPKPLVAQLDGIATVTVAASSGTEEGENPFTVAAAEGADPQPGDPVVPPPPDDDPGEEDPGDEDPDPSPRPTQSPEECDSSIECDLEDILDPSPSPTPPVLDGGND